MKDVMVPVTVEYVKAAQNIVGAAAKRHADKSPGRVRYADRSRAGNTKRIGWAISVPGKGSFGSIETQGAGNTSATGARPPKKDSLAIIVATTSGYGGYLEVGTRKMRRAFPYIRPARDAELPKLKRRLKGCIK